MNRRTFLQTTGLLTVSPLLFAEKVKPLKEIRKSNTSNIRTERLIELGDTLIGTRDTIEDGLRKIIKREDDDYDHDFYIDKVQNALEGIDIGKCKKCNKWCYIEYRIEDKS